MTLQELFERMRQHNLKLDDQFGELLLEDEIEASNIDNSITWWADYMANKYIEANAEADKCRSLAAKYIERAKMFDNAADYRKQGLFQLVSMLGKTIKTASATIYKSKSQASLYIDEDAVPDEFMKVVKTPIKSEIKKALEGGLIVNWAKLEEPKEYVVVRV